MSVDGNKLEQQDIAARARALEPARSFIVQAPAGSGKTELLTQRFLVLLAHVESPEEIVALTFTRKAAGEMMDRVLKALQSADGPEPEEPHRRRTWMLAKAAMENDRARGWNLAASPGRLRVQTIDSLCALITRCSPVATGFGSQPRVTEQPDEAYREAAGELLARVEEDGPVPDAVRRLLEHLDNSFGTVEKLIVAMLGARDQWLRHLPDFDRDPEVDAEATADTYRKFLEESLAHFVREGLVAAHARMSASGLLDELFDLLPYAIGNLGKSKPDSPHLALTGLVALPGTEPDDVPMWLSLCGFLMTNTGSWRSGVDAKLGFPPTDKPRKERMKELLQGFASVPGLGDALAALRSLPPAEYTPEQWEVLRALFVLLPAAEEALLECFRRSGEVDFIEISRRAAHVIETAGGVDAVLSPGVRHLLVDEFQDTSYSQYGLVRLLMTGWKNDPKTGEGDHTFFAVGDPMQSIYRFREAEVGLYLRVVREKRMAGMALEPLELRRNFRARPGLVDWVNTHMAAAFPAKQAEDVLTGAVAYSPCTATRSAVADGGPAVTIHAFAKVKDLADFAVDAEAEDAEAEDGNGAETPPDAEDDADSAVELPTEEGRVVELLRAELDQRAATGGGTTAILVRARSHLPRILHALRDAGITFQAVEIDGLAGRPVVRDLLVLTRALTHPADDIAWLAVLRAPWCGLTLNDLHAVVTTMPPGGVAADETTPDGHPAPRPQRPTVWECLQNLGAAMTALSDDGRVRLARVRPVLEAAMARRGRCGLRALVESTWFALGGPACLSGPTGLEEARGYLELLDGVDDGGLAPDMALLDRMMESLFAPPDMNADGSVQVMSIHKAKGLEFDTVIVPGLAKQTSHDSTRLLQWAEVGSADEEDYRLLLGPVAPKGKKDDAVTAFLSQIRNAKAKFEACRLLYVAVTRARERLHLMAEMDPTKRAKKKAGSDEKPEISPRSDSLLALLWDNCPDVRADALAQIKRAWDDFLGPVTEESEEDEDIYVELGDDEELDGDGDEPPRNHLLTRLPSDWSPRPIDDIPATLVERVLELEGADDDGPAAPGQDEEPDGRLSLHHASAASRCAGTVVHRILCRISAEGLDVWTPDRVRAGRAQYAAILRGQGVPPGDEFDRALERITDALLHTVGDETGRWILGPHPESRSEFPVTGVVDGVVVNGILDRLVVDDTGLVWVVDYKTSEHEGADSGEFLDEKMEFYRAQLDRYAVLIGAMRGVDPASIRRMLYFPLMREKREW